MKGYRLSAGWVELAAMSAMSAMLVAMPAVAHHSFGEFDLEREVTLEGVVVEFDWTHPHTWTRIDVIDENGSVTRWSLEGMSPSYLGRRGWTKDTLAPGERLEVVAFPYKSGEPVGMLLKCTLANGTVKVMVAR